MDIGSQKPNSRIENYSKAIPKRSREKHENNLFYDKDISFEE